MAEAFLRHLASARPGLSHLDVGSAGTIALDGNRPLQYCVNVMRDEFGIDMTAHRARRVNEGLQADVILTMDHAITRELDGSGVKGAVFLLGDYAGSPGETVEDPYGGAEEDYRQAARQIERLVHALADRLEGGSSPRP